MTTREKIAHRPFRLEPSDYEGAAAVINAANESFGSDRRISAADMKTFITAPEYVLDQAIVFEQDGHIVGWGDFEIAEGEGVVWADAVVHPDYTRRGMGQAMIDAADALIPERANAILGADHPLVIRRSASSLNTAALDLFRRNGYTHGRTFYDMQIDLTDAQPPQALPEGFRFVPFDRELHGYKLYEAHEDAFSEHWGHERETWEEWQHYVYDREWTDFSLWLIAWDGDEIAGYTINRQFRMGDPTFAWVGSLGVLKPYHKRGLGSALLNHSFDLFKSRGYTIAGLGVDADNTTNALKVYERVRMHIQRSTYSFQKRLR